MQEVSRMIWRFSRSVQTFFVFQIPAMSAYQGAYGGFLLVLLKAVQKYCMFVRVSAAASSAFQDFSRGGSTIIDISKNIHPAQSQQPSTFPLLATSVQDGALRHGRDPLHGNGALRSLKAEH